MSNNNFKLLANNKKAYFDYFIEDKWEAGVALYGTGLNPSVWERSA